MEARVSIIIPTWNQRGLLVACLESLAAQTCRDFETVVVDDGSTDDTAEVLARDFPQVCVVGMDKNRGFCRAVNAGIRAADLPLVLLLNNDMTLDPDFVERMLAAADARDEALFAPLVLWRDEPDFIYSAGDRQLANGRPESIGFRCVAKGFGHPETVFGVSAGAALIRREVFDRVGLFDERFVAYFEDADLCFRARLAGFKAAFVPEAVAYHVGSASIRKRSWWRSRQCYRNHALLVVKNMPLRLLMRYAGAILAERLHQTRRVVSSARVEFGLVRALGVLVGAWASTVAQLPWALRQRWRIQRDRTIAVDDLDALLTHGSGRS